MSQPLFAIEFNAVTEDREQAGQATLDVLYRLQEDGAQTIRYTTVRVAPGVWFCKVWFRSRNANEATRLMHRAKNLPGLPPLDAFALRLL